jgi:hypothetical protein
MQSEECCICETDIEICSHATRIYCLLSACLRIGPRKEAGGTDLRQGNAEGSVTYRTAPTSVVAALWLGQDHLASHDEEWCERAKSTRPTHPLLLTHWPTCLTHSCARVPDERSQSSIPTLIGHASLDVTPRHHRTHFHSSLAPASASTSSGDRGTVARQKLSCGWWQNAKARGGGGMAAWLPPGIDDGERKPDAKPDASSRECASSARWDVLTFLILLTGPLWRRIRWDPGPCLNRSFYQSHVRAARCKNPEPTDSAIQYCMVSERETPRRSHTHAPRSCATVLVCGTLRHTSGTSHFWHTWPLTGRRLPSTWPLAASSASTYRTPETCPFLRDRDIPRFGGSGAGGGEWSRSERGWRMEWRVGGVEQVGPSEMWRKLWGIRRPVVRTHTSPPCSLARRSEEGNEPYL